MPRTIRTKVYKFNELSEAAQQRVIENNRDINVDYDWWKYVYEDFHGICNSIGIDVDIEKTYFSGFSHQGQGATFTANIILSGLIKGINNASYLEYAPNLTKDNSFTPSKLSIDSRVLSLIERGFIDISLDIQANDRYKKSKLNFECSFNGNSCEYTRIEVELSKLESWLEDITSELDALLFSLLEREYEYQTSNEAIKETIIANEYEFTKDGNRF